MTTLLLAWQHPVTREWFPIGRLARDEGVYRFRYVRGFDQAVKAGLQPLMAFPDPDAVYVSRSLFPFFQNRVMSPHREDYAEYVSRLGVPPDERDPLPFLAISEGRLTTDAFEVFPAAERDSAGRYAVRFFVRGLRHLASEDSTRAEALHQGERLDLVPDPQNQADSRAMFLVTADGHRVGYVPRYLTEDLQELRGVHGASPVAVVERVNPAPVPLQQRVICSLSCPWPEGFASMSSGQFQPRDPDQPRTPSIPASSTPAR